MDFLGNSFRRASLLASLLLALTTCAPKDSDSQNNTDTETVSPASTASTTGSCGTVACDVCDALDEQECSCCIEETANRDPCAPLYGDRLDRENDCVEHSVFAACVPAMCSTWAVPYQAPDGTCWWFSEDCLEGADGWTQDEGADLCPELADSESLPPPC